MQDIDFGHYLDLKYQNMGMQARAALIDAQARAGLLGAQAGQVAANDATSRALNLANAGNAKSEARQRDLLTPGLVASGQGIAAQNIAAGKEAEYGASPTALERVIEGFRLLNPFEDHPTLYNWVSHPDNKGYVDSYSQPPGGQPSFLGTALKGIGNLFAPSAPANTSKVQFLGPGGEYKSQDVINDIGGQKKGIARVPGKGDGTKDTVKAKLAPGEAVLNKKAADHMGRGLIAALNKMGAQRMGLT